MPKNELLMVLIAVAESKNFYEAADKLHITQSSVSLKMKELESLVPLPVFQLEGKKKVLTHFGRNLFHLAKEQNFMLEQKIEDLYRHYSSAEKLTLRVGSRLEILKYISLNLNFPGKIEMINLSSADTVNKLLAHEIDIGITYLRPDSTEVVAKKIFTSSCHFIIHKKLLGKRKLNLKLIKDLDFLADKPCIVYDKNGPMLKSWLNFIGQKYEDLKLTYSVEDWGVVQFLVESEKGYALVPSYVINSSSDVVSIELPSEIMPSFTYYALYEKGLTKIESFKKALASLEV